jgi:type IV pilus assembly protein PilY1
MTLHTNQTHPLAVRSRAAWLAVAGALMLLGAGASMAQVVSQDPLSVGGDVPGNLVLTPSVEFPTINSKANISAFAPGTEYVGYFDPRKCYLYHYDAIETQRHFYPSRVTAGPAVCSAASLEWSGNWLNWATTQTIDPFRKALTGGLRALDTPTETWLEKARHDGQGGPGYFPNANTPSSDIAGAIPSSAWTALRSRVFGAGNQLLFTSTCPANPTTIDATAVPTAVDFIPGTTLLNNAIITTNGATCGTTTVNLTNANRIYRVSVRVKVCDSAVGLEANCVRYASGYKPAGLIQKYSGKIRFSIFGYLLDNGAYRDGGVMRARQKFVGPQFLNKATSGWEANSAREWDDNGTFIDNPDSADATATQTIVAAGTGFTSAQNIRYSGVVNYLNLFGQLTGTNAKNYDPVSEMYYTSLRYLRKLPNVPIYSDITQQYATAGGAAVGTALGRFNLTDGFPVISDWYPASNPDPYEYWCQSTAILGIGDVYTHKDKNLTGHTGDTTNEPGMPALVSSDPDFSGTGKNSIRWWTEKVYTKEFAGSPAMPMPLDSGLNSSAYIAGLAYYAHTQDLRPEAAMQEKQTISTHWVDVREVQRLEPRRRNQYWLAGKYGGFQVPDDYDATSNTPLQNNWWSTAGDTVTSNGTVTPNETFLRGNNYYVADKPQTMVDSLTRAFARIASERNGTGVALAANSTRLDTETRVFQAQFSNGSWLGQLSAYDFITSGTSVGVSTTPLWNAGEKVPAWASRNIFVNGSSYSQFRWGNLTTAQQTALDSLSAVLTPATGADIVDYLRGNQALEESATAGTLRTRTAPSPTWSPILGDIVNSTPVFVGAPLSTRYTTSPGTWSGKTAHQTFALANATRLPTIWVGANDGMMHAFNATTGTAASGAEIYAFVPKTAIANGLVNFADPDYQHRYSVDGDSAIADVYDTATSTWKTILIGTMGRGGPGVFALNITDPNNVRFLWERDATDIPALGHNIGMPIIAQVADGDWRVLFGNGPDSASGEAQLITINVLTGAANVTNAGNAGTNGMSAVSAIDSNLDGFADAIFAGDLRGHIYKITDFLAGAGTVQTLFSATDPTNNSQPIMVSPLVNRDPATGLRWVFFGTGKYLAESDLTTSQVQTWYGFRDEGTAVTKADLLPRVMSAGGDVVGDFTTRSLAEAVSGDLAGKKGWYINLPVSRERMVVPNQLTGTVRDKLLGLSRIPDSTDACQPTGRSFLMAINAYTGGRLQAPFFDTNNDGLINQDDKVNDEDGRNDEGSGDGDGETEVPPALGFEKGAAGFKKIGELVCVTLDDGTVKCTKTADSGVQGRRGSWREITN